MCGIAGILTMRGAHDGPLRDSVGAMARLLAHRGPDAEGFASLSLGSARLALAHRRLAILDLSPEGEQPMRLPERGLTISFNGEIFNYRELRAELQARGELFTTATDTEVLLRAWAVWGEDALPRLEGMFAFALADERAGTLALVRDPFGIKPLYVHEAAGEVVFASEVRALLRSGRVPREIDGDAIGPYLAFGSAQSPQTLVRGVRSLEPGSVETFGSEGRLRTRRYWSLAEAVSAREPATAEEVGELTRRAVGLETVSDVPLGAFLSGGVDSSAIVGILAGRNEAIGGPPPVTVSLVFDEARYSEAEHSRAVAAYYGTDHREIEVRAASVAEILPGIPEAQDQPSVDGINTWLVSRAAREAGLTVALSGLGGDELFAGYDLFRFALRWQDARGLTARVPRPLASAALAAARLLPTRLLPSGRAKMVEAALQATSLGDLQRLFHRLLNFDEVAALTGRTPVLPVAPNTDGLDPVAAISVLETSRYMRDTLLRDADAMSMAHSLEVRVPLLNPRLASAVVSAPARLKLGAGPKPLLTGAVPKPLPASITDRRKGTFTLPFEVWMRGPLREFVRESVREAPGLDPKAVARLWSRFERGEPGVNWARVWAIADLALWTRAHLGPFGGAE